METPQTNFAENLQDASNLSHIIGLTEMLRCAERDRDRYREALVDISDWNDRIEYKWGDPGFRAITALDPDCSANQFVDCPDCDGDGTYTKHDDDGIEYCFECDNCKGHGEILNKTSTENRKQ